VPLHTDLAPAGSNSMPVDPPRFLCHPPAQAALVVRGYRRDNRMVVASAYHSSGRRGSVHPAKGGS
jgi:hypothetical protein